MRKYIYSIAPDEKQSQLKMLKNNAKNTSEGFLLASCIHRNSLLLAHLLTFAPLHSCLYLPPLHINIG